jgi:hypothetical protein
MIAWILLATSQEELHTPTRRLRKREGIRYRQKMTAMPDSGDLATVEKISPGRSMGGATEMRQPIFSEGCNAVGQTVWFVEPKRLAEIEWDESIKRKELGQKEADK